MKALKIVIALVVISLFIGAWILHFHTAWFSSGVKPESVMGRFFAFVGEPPPPPPPEEDPDNTKNEIPVHTAHVSLRTMHQYVDAFGTIAPRPPRAGQMAGSASIASPVAGVVLEVLCQTGQHVNKGDALIQLDDRLAKATEQQADAAVVQARASLENLQASRPRQLEIAQSAVDKARSAADFFQKNLDRLQLLASDQGTSAKSVEQARQDLASAKSDALTAEGQLALAKASNSNGTFAEDNSKVSAAEAALASAKMQRQMMRIVAPIDGTVVQMNVNPGEGVDPTKTLVQVIALDRLMVDVDVPVEKLPSLAEGLPVIVTSSVTTKPSSGDDAPEPQGKVVAISPDVNPKTGTVKVDIDLPAGSLIRPGLSVRVRIIAEEHKDKLVVPRESVATDDNGDSRIAIVEGDRATRKTVHIGIIENGLIEVDADGLKEGDTVVTAGAYGLPDATRVKVMD